MRKVDFAELVLSLVTTREHAASIVGDLLEDGQAGNPCRFWFFVVQTAIAQVWRGLAAAPLRMGGTAVRAMFVEMGLLVLWGAALVVVMFGPATDIWRTMRHESLPGWATQLPLILSGWATQLPFLLSSAIVPFTLGRWISRRYPGREGEGILTLAAAHALTNVGAAIASWLAAQAGGHVHLVVTVFVPVISWDGNVVHALLYAGYYLTLYPMLLFAGAMTVRAQSLKSAA